MIEKVISFFWANDTMSWLRYMTLYSFRKLNPDWKMVLYLCKKNSIVTKTWTEYPKQDFFNFNGKDYLKLIYDLGIEIKNWELQDLTGKQQPEIMGASQKSNFFKWNLLAKTSGFFSDLDILFIKPMNEYYEKVKDKELVIGIQDGWFQIYLMASSGNNKFFEEVYKNAFSRVTPKQYQSAGVISIYNLLGKLSGNGEEYGINNCKKIFEMFYSDIKHYNNEMELVTPWTWNGMRCVFEEQHKTLPPNCIGIHWFGASLEAQKYNNILTEENYKAYNNTICHFLGEILQ